MNGELRKALFQKAMKRNAYYKCRTNANWEAYRCIRNRVTSLRRTSIRKYFQERCSNTGNKNDFWKTVKPFLNYKSNTSNDHITLREGDNLITDPLEVCNSFNDFFINVAENIGFKDSIESCSTVSDIKVVINRHANHPSVLEIEKRIVMKNVFNFTHTSEPIVIKTLKCIDKESNGCR